MNLKSEVLNVLENIENSESLKNLVVESIDASKGDFCLPCFSLAKEYRKNPMAIAEEIASSLNLESSNIAKVECVAGYINFFLNKEKLFLLNFNKEKPKTEKVNSGLQTRLKGRIAYPDKDHLANKEK